MTQVIAHRGARKEAPENTVAAFQEAVKLPGVFGVELDVEFSDKPVVLHQESMVPTIDFSALQLASRDFEKRDWVSEFSSEEITQLDAGSWMGVEFSGLRVPLLSEVLAFNWCDKHVFVELKDPTYWGSRDLGRPKRIADAVAPLLMNSEVDLSVVSFNPEILKEVRNRMPEVPVVLALWTEWQNRSDEAIELARNAGAYAISLSDQMILSFPRWVEEIQSRDLKVHAYPVSPTVDEPEYQDWNPNARQVVWESLLELKIDALLTDFPRELLNFIG